MSTPLRDALGTDASVYLIQQVERGINEAIPAADALIALEALEAGAGRFTADLTSRFGAQWKTFPGTTVAINSFSYAARQIRLHLRGEDCDFRGKAAVMILLVEFMRRVEGLIVQADEIGGRND